MRALRAWVFASAALAFAGVAHVTSAAPAAYELDYVVDPDCPDLTQFVRLIATRTPNAEHAPGRAAQRFVIRMSRRGDEWLGQLELRPNEEPRSVLGPSCESVAEALGLIVAVALDPAIVLELSPPAAQPEPSAEPGEERSLPPPESPASRPERTRTMALLGTGTFVASGPAPTALYGVSFFGELELERRTGPALRLAVSRASTGIDDVASGAARFVLTTARLEGCPGAMALADVLLTGCLGAEGGALAAEGFARGEVEEASAVTRLWFELGVTSRFSVIVIDALRLELFGGVGLPLTRRGYVFENPRESVHEPTLLAGRAGLALAAEIP